MVATILQDALFVVVTTTIHATRANRDILDLLVWIASQRSVPSSQSLYTLSYHQPGF